MASFALVKASKSETWNLVLCLWTHSMKGVLDLRHKDRHGFTDVVIPPIASLAHLEIHFSRRSGVQTSGQHLLCSVVVLLSIVVIRICPVGCAVQRHMPPPDVRLSGTESTSMWLPELPGLYLDTVRVLRSPCRECP